MSKRYIRSYSDLPSKPFHLIVKRDMADDLVEAGEEVLMNAVNIDLLEDDYKRAVKDALRATKRDGIRRDVQIVLALKATTHLEVG